MRMLNGAGVLTELGSLAQRLADPGYAARSTTLMVERCDFDDGDAERYRANIRTLADALQFATVLIMPDAIRVETERLASMGLQPPAWADEHFHPAAYPLIYFAHETPPIQTDEGPMIATLIEISKTGIGLTTFIDEDGVILAHTRMVSAIGKPIDPTDAHAVYHVAMLEGLRRGALKLTHAREHADEADELRRLGFENIPGLYFLSIVLRQEGA
jgi:hypothetical protein